MSRYLTGLALGAVAGASFATGVATRGTGSLLALVLAIVTALVAAVVLRGFARN